MLGSSPGGADFSEPFQNTFSCFEPVSKPGFSSVKNLVLQKTHLTGVKRKDEQHGEKVNRRVGKLEAARQVILEGEHGQEPADREKWQHYNTTPEFELQGRDGFLAVTVPAAQPGRTGRRPKRVNVWREHYFRFGMFPIKESLQH